MRKELSLFEEKRQLVEKELEILLPQTIGPLKQLYEASHYALLGPGKRLRPLLALTTCIALGGQQHHALPAACALEMIHAYSLIHDDLPCMDDDDFRRGRLTLHRAFSEGHAVLTGDFLLTKAFEVIATTSLLNAEQKIETITALTTGAGDAGMLGGQVMDIAAQGRDISLDALQQIHKKKTGALIATACRCGAIAAQATPRLTTLLHTIGEKLGFAFQIIDDILDITASEQKHGYATASDKRNAKTTYVSLLGIEKAQQEANELLRSACEQISVLPGDTKELHTLAELLIYESFDTAQER